MPGTSNIRPTEKARMLSFALQWQHYGGGSNEDIYVNFGLSPKQYFIRLLRILRSPTELDIRVISELNELCVSRLAAERICLHDKASQPLEGEVVKPFGYETISNT